MNKFNIKFFLGIILLTLILFSCKTTRTIIKEPIKEYGADYLFEQLKKNELKFNFFSAKFSIVYINDKNKVSFRGQIRIKKDSLIWISFSPALGIEVARLMITDDSVRFINRINDTYFIGDYDFVNDFLETNIDFDIIQSFITGNDFTYYENGKFRASIDSKEYRLSTAARSKLKKYVKESEENPKVFIQTIWLNPENFKISQVHIKEIKKENIKLEAIYDDFIFIDQQLFPSNINFHVLAENNIKLSVDYSKIIINKPLRFPFKIPRKFTQIQ